MKTVKTLLQGETGFPPCQQELTGFRSGGSPIYHVSDRRRLSELNLPKENVLYLNTPPPEGKNCGWSAVNFELNSNDIILFINIINFEN